MPNKGLRFLGTDYCELQFGGSPSASSSIANADFAFDGLLGTRWISSGENTDGNSVYVEMDFGFNRTIDSFFVLDSNIEDMEIQTWNGSAWVTANSSIATITKSSDLMNMFVKLTAEVTVEKVRVAGSNTIVANSEKYVTLFHAFQEIGQFEYFPDFTPTIEPKQNVFSTTDGRGFVIERGESFSAKIDFKSHVNQNDIDLAEELLQRKEPFYIWPNGGNDSIFTYSFRPFRFQDLYKVTIIGKHSPKFSNNYYKAGFNASINLVEVV